MAKASETVRQSNRLRRVGFATAAAAGLLAAAAAQEQYPKPLIHTPENHPAARVLLLSVDGMHALDLAHWVAAHPESTLAELSRRGVTYTNAHTTAADPAAGLVSMATGGTPISTGILGSEVYERGVGTKALTHAQVRVNTIFEVVHEKIGPTAWAGESAAITDLMRGPSGHGLDQACAFGAGDGDDARVAAVLHWIDGKDCAGSAQRPVPALFGMTFVGVETAEEAPGTGYVDAAGTMSTGLSAAFAGIDAAMGRLVQELKAKGLYDSTWIFVTSPFGDSPMDAHRRRVVPLERLRETAGSGRIAHISGGDVAMLWLRDSAETAAVVKRLGDQAAALGIAEIYSGARLALTLNTPARDARMPDIVLQPEMGVLWLTPGDKRLAAHGGWGDEDTHVPMLVAGAQLTGRSDPTSVPTTQMAALLLRALGMEKFDLQALHLEHSPALPGIF